MPRTLLTFLAAVALSALAGCADLRYYWQSVHGHVQLMQAAAPLEDWLQRPDLAAPLRTRLLLAQRARAFAVDELGLPDNASYHRYADLQRTAAVWNVVAAPPDALTPHTWCFIVTGCIAYRGYFAQADAQAEAAQLAAQGLEVNVYGVPAYSTLGYLNWAGGDPLLSTFIGWPRENSCVCCSTSWHTRWCMCRATPPSMNRLPLPWSVWAARAGWPRSPHRKRARPLLPARNAARPGKH